MLCPDSVCGVAFCCTEFTLTLSTVTCVAHFACSTCISPSVLSPVALRHFRYQSVLYLLREPGQFEKLTGIRLGDSKDVLDGSKL